MNRTAFATCPLCEAMCGITVHLDGDRVTRIEGDPDDVHSRGHVCPKATALADLQSDPGWLRSPMRREGDDWRPIPWDEAFDLAGRRLGAIQRTHGRDALATYYGNPTGHSYRAMLGVGLMRGPLGTANQYSAASVDQLPRTVSAWLIHGNQARLPVPDIDRTHYMLVLGANPVISQGSVMSAPGMKRRLKELRARGGRLRRGALVTCGPMLRVHRRPHGFAETPLVASAVPEPRPAARLQLTHVAAWRRVTHAIAQRLGGHLNPPARDAARGPRGIGSSPARGRLDGGAPDPGQTVARARRVAAGGGRAPYPGVHPDRALAHRPDAIGRLGGHGRRMPARSAGRLPARERRTILVAGRCR